jgi:3-phosphoshikimate 1-carboxyvinyltransferase
MTTLVVHPAETPLAGSVPVPSDASIGRRALLLGALCRGETTLSGFSRSPDTLSIAGCLRAMGVSIVEASPTELVITGVGLGGLREPVNALDCGHSGATLRLFCGVLAAQRFRATLRGDAGLSQASMIRVVAPLRARGAVVSGQARAIASNREGDLSPPLVVGPLPEGRRLAGLQYETAVASALVKSAVLLSGLFADGITLFKEPSVSRDHTERMLGTLGVPIRTVGPLVQIDPAGWDREMPAFQLSLPGDLSAAAFPLAAAQLVAGSRVTVRGVGANPTRTGLLEVARDMGAGFAIEPQGERGGEPVAELHAWYAPLRAVALGGETVSRATDEIPIACALAARARGTTRITDVAPLRDSDYGDRIGAIAAMLRAFGVECEERPDGLSIGGREDPLEAVDIESGGDPRIAMTASVLALVGRGPSRIRDAACIAEVYPKFVATLRALGARIDIE